MTTRHGKLLDHEPNILKTKDKKVTFDLPSVYTLNFKSRVKARHTMRPSSFVQAVWAKTDTSHLRTKHTDFKFPSWLRNRLLSLVSEAAKDSRIHFNNTELAILFQMYFQLAHQEVRSLKLAEVEQFLYSTLDISHGLTLTRLAQAALLIRTGRNQARAKSVNPIEFVLLISILLRGKITERADLAFYAMDVDGDGFLRQPAEFTALLQNSFPPEFSSENADMDPEQPVREAIAFLTHKAGIRRGGSLDLEAFRKLAASEPWMVDSLLHCIPSDSVNMAFQSTFTANVVLPAREPTSHLWSHSRSAQV
ncbi:unnamed protein product [Schistocephalus solidus]|uniref:EF-hand domain-containing protein n=1 Tax=Schistocephalus solidus TaxID=70667 RepID=A0A183TR78_SCHSO|nr:unnamed protein product [Schistocephalus solidus]